MAELADAQASGACGSNLMRVQVPPSAQKVHPVINTGCQMFIIWQVPPRAQISYDKNGNIVYSMADGSNNTELDKIMELYKQAGGPEIKPQAAYVKG